MAWIAAAVMVVVVTAIAYLRPSSPAFTPMGAPPVKPGAATANFVMYDFPSSTVGWALGFADGTSGFSVSRTIDGGNNWQRRLSSGLVVAAPVVLRFFNDKRGFVAVGAQLLRTSDGGASWKSLPLPDPRNSYPDFSDERRGWLLVPSADGARQPAHLYATDDAGDTWRKLPDPPSGAGVFSFRGASEAWLAPFNSGSAIVYRSIDGGISWQPREISISDMTPETGPWNVSLIVLPGKGVIASVLCNCTSAGGPSRFATYDGGASWRLLASHPGKGPFFFAYQDDDHWWTIDATTLYRTSDAGRTWTTASYRLPDWQFVPHAIDQNHAWASIGVAGGYGLATTSDAGAHWTRVAVPQSPGRSP